MRTPVLLAIQLVLLVGLGYATWQRIAGGGEVQAMNIVAIVGIGALAALSVARLVRERRAGPPGPDGPGRNPR